MTFLESPYPLSYLRYIIYNDLESIFKELEACSEDDLWPPSWPWRKGHRGLSIKLERDIVTYKQISKSEVNSLYTFYCIVLSRFELWPLPDLDLRVTGSCRSNSTEIFWHIDTMQSLTWISRKLFPLSCYQGNCGLTPVHPSIHPPTHPSTYPCN